MAQKILDVRNLRISFRTNSGTVKAVRDISFSVNKGETLAIVGESGSGKSVTAKAILGILAKNSIIEGGEIIYDGMDLLKLSEEEFNQLRGNRLSMIYQDPLSSLDPIMRIGKQMTEATLINGKTAHKHGKKNFDGKVKQLSGAMKAAGIPGGEVDRIIGVLTKLVPIGSKLRVDYRNARDYAESAVFSCEQVAVAAKKQDSALLEEEVKYLKERVDGSKNPYLLPDTATVEQLKNGLPETVSQLEQLLQEAVSREEPDYYAIAHAQLNGGVPAFDPDDVKGWNQKLRASANEDYSGELVKAVSQAMRHSAEEYLPKKQKVLALLEQYLPLFRAETLDTAACKKAVDEMSKAVAASIDPLPTIKDSAAHTFGSTMAYSLKRYTKGIPGNARELKRVEKETAKYEKDIQRKADVPKVIPAVLVDLDLTRNTMLLAMEELQSDYQEQIRSFPQHDFDQDARNMVTWLEEQGDAMVTKVTKQQAYDKAIRIMEDVGIAEPRKRFEQYPFEFSGGMRQRIVIAIAMAANLDVLICDEPTTALDVTIQAQILELINDLKRKRNLTVIFITHDLGVVANIADKVAVMYAGKLVEYGTVEDVFYEPAHPYTWALLSSMPDLDTSERLESIPGTPPNMIYPPKGDAFAARNKYALAIDFEEQPPQFELSETHWAATWLLHPKAPKVEVPHIVTERIARMKKLEEEARQNDRT